MLNCYYDISMNMTSTDMQPWFGPHCEEWRFPGSRTVLPWQTSYNRSMCCDNRQQHRQMLFR